MKPIVLSLGAGVQSSTILLLSCHGLLPKIDLAIFADTGWERLSTYQHLNWLETEAQKYGIPTIRVSNGGDIRDGVIVQKGDNAGKHSSLMPFHGYYHNHPIMMKRQCTHRYKIQPIRKKIRELFDITSPKLSIGVDLWLGISTDERQRIAGYYGAKYAMPKFPIIDIKPMSRTDCIEWLKEVYPNHIPTKSSCIGCPFHDNSEWRLVYDTPEEWKQAVEFDKYIRGKGFVNIKSIIYLHKDKMPLEEVDMRTEIEKGQLILPEFEKLWGRQNDFLKLGASCE
jgi:hypothetical protein